MEVASFEYSIKIIDPQLILDSNSGGFSFPGMVGLKLERIEELIMIFDLDWFVAWEE